jgi:DNA-binding MarR family transcriptional regulator
MDFIRSLGPLVLDHRFRRMTDTLLRTAEELYEARGLPFRARWASTYQLLFTEGPLAITELADRLRLTHPAVIGITDDMRANGIVTDVRDRHDARRRMIALTARARQLDGELRELWKALADAQRQRFEDAGVDIVAVLDRVEDDIATRPLTAEVLTHLGEPRRSPSRALRRRATIATAVALCLTGTAARAQQTPATTSAVVRAVADSLVNGYIYESKGREMADSLQRLSARGHFDSLADASLADELTRVLRRTSRDAHLSVGFDAPQAPSPASPTRMVRRRPSPSTGDLPNSDPVALGFARVERLPGDVGYLDMRMFSDAPEALRFADSVLASFAGVRALIIDLGENRGGGPEMVRLISSYLFDRPTHLVSSFRRGMSEAVERWTLPQVRGRRLPTVPVFVLTSSRTISAAESFVFGLKAHGRITIVGEPTAGGGHFGDIVRLPGGFSMFLPRGRTYDPRTNVGWEATGIPPDVPVPYARALDTALDLANAKRR